ncbi:MAG: hypothetical protein PVJ07_05375 [Anaerolineales bacterium]
MPYNRSQVARRQSPYAHLRPRSTFKQTVLPDPSPPAKPKRRGKKSLDHIPRAG